MNLWIRCGDSDIYNNFDDDFDATAEYLASLGVDGPLVWCDLYGVSAPGMTGLNYISLFWGDDDAQPERELTDEEVADLNECLSAMNSTVAAQRYW